jgi:hypothetical protein
MNYEEGFSYFAHHKPTGEDWYLLGIDVKNNKVCVAGWPATIGNLSDCEDLKKNEKLTEEELKHRRKKFGNGWI